MMVSYFIPITFLQFTQLNLKTFLADLNLASQLRNFTSSQEVFLKSPPIESRELKSGLRE
jgi:hypothetical protein